MWEQYKKRFWGMQLLIAIVVFGIFYTSRGLLVPAATFFVTMQVAAVLGAAWAHRLKKKIQGPTW